MPPGFSAAPLGSSPLGSGEAPGVAASPCVDLVRYQQRNVVERAIGRLKQHRAIATRYDSSIRSYPQRSDRHPGRRRRTTMQLVRAGDAEARQG